MEYIDKHQTANIKRFNAYIDGLIAQGKTHYKGLEDAERNSLKAFLSGEQSHRCAYCMQTQNGGGTVEHVIPQGIKLPNFAAAYRKGNYYPQFFHQKMYARSPQTGVYPHTLAYGNVVMACGSCNSHKWEQVIKPTFFESPITVSYNDDGIAVFQPDDLEPNLKAYLNGSTFVRYRSLWRAIKRGGYSLAQVNACGTPGSRRSLLDTVVPHMSRDLQTLYNGNPYRLINDKSWGRLLSFDWFWGYY